MKLPLKCEGCWYDDLYPHMTDFMSGNLEMGHPENIGALRNEMKAYIALADETRYALMNVKPTVFLDKDGNVINAAK